MENELRLKLFWLAQAIFWGAFALEIAWIVSIWLRARVPNAPDGASRWTKGQKALGNVFRLISSRRLGKFLRILVTDGLVHQKLARTYRTRWSAHMLVLGTWLVLGTLSTITGFVVEILPLLGLEINKVVAIPILGQLYHADVWWVALLNELLGLIMILGIGMILYRRYVQRDPQLRTSRADTFFLLLIAFIAASGFPTESFRLLADYTTPAGLFLPNPTMLPLDNFPLALYPVWGPGWGMVGFQIAKLLGNLTLGSAFWRILHNIAFWIHVGSFLALIGTLPFTRFFHAIMSPLVVAFNTLEERERFEKNLKERFEKNLEERFEKNLDKRGVSIR